MIDYLADEPPIDPDATFRNFQRHNARRAAVHFGVAATGTPVFGWRLRTISIPVTGQDGSFWLRVASEEAEWARGDGWTGNVDANVITEVARPRVLDVFEWPEGTWRHQRAELMTVLPGEPCSPTDVLRWSIDLPDAWWAELRRTVDTVRSASTSRVNADQDKVNSRVRTAFGDQVELTVDQWETVHGDLHWANLFRSPFGLADWELWGTGPAGTDAATLYCYSLPVPSVARKVRTVFADQLDTAAGSIALTVVSARLLGRIDRGDYPELAEPLRQLVTELSG